MTRTAMTLAIALGMVLGCTAAEDQDTTVAEEGFQLIQHEETTLEAQVVSGGESLYLLVVEYEPGVVDVTFDFADTIVGISLDYNKGEGAFMPGPGTLDASDARLVDLMFAELEEIISPDSADRTRVEDAAYRQASYMQEAPRGEKLADFQFTSDKSWVHISCSCYNQYIGSGYYRIAGKGCGCTGGSGRGCKGRCGQGCGITSYPRCVGSTAYTRDCAKHDYGLGSWFSASDDFSFASNNCSCSGVGTCY